MNKPTQQTIIENYCRKHNETIESMEVHDGRYKVATAVLASGRSLVCNMTDGMISASANVRNAFRLYDRTSGKWVRIKKSEW